MSLGAELPGSNTCISASSRGQRISFASGSRNAHAVAEIARAVELEPEDDRVRLQQPSLLDERVGRVVVPDHLEPAVLEHADHSEPRDGLEVADQSPSGHNRELWFSVPPGR